jgi:hypothetical protein
VPHPWRIPIGEFDAIAGTVLGRMGLARPGAQGANP